MEELNLEDLDFDTSGIQLFDDKEDIPQNSTQDEKTVKEEASPAEATIEEINTDSDDDASASQESVADQSKDTNQVQAGKTTEGAGGDSSSPKLNENEQLYSKLAAEFKAKGVLPELDTEKIKSLEDIESAIRSKIENSLTDRQKAIEEAQKVGAPVNKVVEVTETISKLKKITPEYVGNPDNVNFRRTAIIQDALSKGYDQERASSIAERSIEAGTDIEDAKFALESINKKEESSLEKIIGDVKEKENDSLNNIKSYISETKEVIPGIQLNDSQKDELYDQITTDLGGKDNAFMKAQKSDPIGSRIKLETLFFITKGLTDFSVFNSIAETKVSSNLEDLIRGASFTESGGVNTTVKDSRSNFKLSDLKDLEIE